LQFKIRFVQTKGSGREVRDVTLTSERASLGRGTDQTIQIPDKRVPLKHSTLTFKNGMVSMKTSGSSTFSVNDSVVKQSDLKPGDIIDVVGHEMRILLEDDGETLALEIELHGAEVEPLRDRFTTRLRQLDIPMRTFSWVLFTIVILVGIIIPSTGIFIGMKPLRDSLIIPDDGIWLAGGLHDTHAFLGDRCENCHTIPFVPAREEDCLTCHLSINHHFNTEELGRDYFVGDTCQDCHREHNGPEAITRRDQPTCTACHADLEVAGYSSNLQPVSDFLEDHPPFMVSMLEEQPDATWVSTRYDIWDDDLVEDSNLKFPHDVHMDPDGLMGVDGNVTMECMDCHGIEKGGMKMKTVTMEQHCASCHDLSFDPAAPDRVVPHGRSDDLINLLRGYYAYEYFQENAAPGSTQIQLAPEPTREARRPGRRKQSIADLQLTIPAGASSAEAKDYVDGRVNDAAVAMFEQRTCVVCHQVGQSDEGEWHVEPVKLTPDWMPMAEFSHDSHVNMACAGCHEASFSEDAGDVLMPDIGTCRTCHGGEHAEGKLQSTCISCHKFHLEEQGPMGMLLAIDQDGNLIDQFGNFVDERGDILKLDEDGYVIVEEEVVEGEVIEGEAVVDPENPDIEAAAAP
jgi:predicted CXXCH cytochrome family protein